MTDHQGIDHGDLPDVPEAGQRRIRINRILFSPKNRQPHFADQHVPHFVGEHERKDPGRVAAGVPGVIGDPCAINVGAAGGAAGLAEGRAIRVLAVRSLFPEQDDL